jgi:putative SbcD/Mre11-related phosphoesterase
MRWGEWLLSPCRLAVHLPTECAVVADLHLGYHQVRRRSGDAIPAPSLSDELQALTAGLRAVGVRKLVIAGDLFEDGRHGLRELEEELLSYLEAERLELVCVVPGNHDRGLCESRLPVRPACHLGAWTVAHGDGPRPEGPCVQGHEHPAVRAAGITRPCFLYSEGHLVLPAYASHAAGCQVLHDRRWALMRCAVVGAEEVVDLGVVSALARRSQPRRIR